MTLVLNGQGHPARMQMFVDGGSITHLTLGFLTGLTPPPANLAIFAGFTGYQVSQSAAGEQWARTGGEFIEFALGLTLAAVLKGLGKL